MSKINGEKDCFLPQFFVGKSVFYPNNNFARSFPILFKSDSVCL